MSRTALLHQIDKIHCLSFPPLERFDFLLHGFLLKKLTSRSLGRFLGKVGSKNSSVIALEQVHSRRILAINKRGGLKKIKTDGYDGILTDVPGIVLTVRVADCLPIFLVDPSLKITGLIHAGWRGTLMGIAGQAIEKASEMFGSNPGNMVVVLGPSIGRCCYQISPSLAILFPGDCLTLAQDKIKLDLAKANLKQLLKSGVKRERIFSSDSCTFCHKDLFYSYRRDKDKEKRMTAFIAIK